MNKKIGIDVDGVLADFNTHFMALLRSIGGDKFPPNVTVGKDYPDCWDYDKAAGYNKEERDKAWDTIKSTDFWFNLGLLDGEQTQVDLGILEDLSENNEVYFITHRTGTQCKQQTEDWLYRHGMSCPTVLIAGDDKRPLISGLGLDFFIDDKLTTIENALMLRQYGLRLYLKDAPYNQCDDLMGVNRVKTIGEALLLYGL